MKRKNLKKFKVNFVADKDNYMSAFRKNVFSYIEDKDITLNQVSEESNIPYATLRTFLYGHSEDCNLSMAVRLARTLGVSIDELVGAETIDQTSRESLSICRHLPENDLYLIRWHIRYIDKLNKQNEPHKRYISVMELECNHHGNLKITGNYKNIDITNVNDEEKYKVFFGITMPCDHYMPTYSPYDILLIANDRLPHINENSLIRIDNIVCLVKRKVEDGIVKYYSIRDGKFRLNEDEVDEVIGYVSCTCKNPN